ATQLLGLAGQATTAEPPVRWMKAYEAFAPKLPADLVRHAVKELNRLHTVDDEYKLPKGVRRAIMGPSTAAKYLAGGVVWTAMRFVDDACLDDLGKMARLHSRMGDSAGLLGPYLIHAIARSHHPKAVH